MKKNFKLVLALVLAAMMIASMIPAMADTTYSLTLTNSGTTAHTFQLYKVFTGDLSDGVLSNIDWADGISSAGQTAAYAMSTNLDSARKVAEYLSAGTTDEKGAKAESFAQIVGQNLGTATTVSSVSEWSAAAGASVTISGLTPGYYFVKDKASTQDSTATGAYTGYILKVVGNVTAQTKIDVPTVVKKVKEKNDTTGVESDWQDAADYDIGDSIPYQITGTLPSNFDKYDTYKKFTFTDTLSAGLTPPTAANVSVMFGEYNLVELNIFEVDVTGQKITVSLKSGVDLRKVKVSDAADAALMFTNGSQIVVSYNATLNNNAVIGSAGNPNEVDLQYSNNPNKGGDGDYGTTPKDKVTVFTYEIDANKVKRDGDGTAALEGAGFTLFKKIDAKYLTNEEKNTTNTTFAADQTIVKVGSGNSAVYYKRIGSEITGVTTFEFKGADAGEYKLVETTVPATYNKADDVDFTVTATYSTDSADPKLLSLTVTPEEAHFTVTITETKKNEKDEVTEIVTDGKAVTSILNEQGATLPETGGIGTTIFYVGGSILVLAAAILLITKRRMSNND